MPDLRGNESDWLAVILRDTADAIIVHDLAGVIVRWNRAAADMYGYSEDAAVGMSMFRLVPPHLAESYRQLLARLAAGESGIRLQTQRLTADGRQLDVELTLSPISKREGRPAIVSIDRDISDRIIAEAQAQRLAAVLRSSSDAITLQTTDGIITASSSR